MLYIDLRLGKALSEDRLEKANARRLQRAAAAGDRRLAQMVGQRLVALGERLEDQQARAA
ncbi:MAG: hypothetical protein PVG83_01045 [Acidimicrobiia bacterium]|jgi:hypothetical protein